MKSMGNVSWDALGKQDTSDVILVSSKIYPGDAAPFAGYLKVSGGIIVEMAPGVPEPQANPTTGDESSKGPGAQHGLPVVDLGDNIIIPGLVDIHIHGSFGFDVSSPDPDAIQALAGHLIRTGTTSFLPTIGAMPVDDIERVISRVSQLASNKEGTGVSEDSTEAEKNLPGAHILGLHMEGPFLNPHKKGAMREEYLLEPSVSLMARWLDLGKGTVKRVTIAPELRGARDLISLLADRGVAVAAGHTMATYQEALDSISWGVSAATHVYNAMREFHHREPGIIGAVLTDSRIWAEVICDGIHVHPAALMVVLACRGADRVYLVSDALAPAGLPPGSYSSLGHEITVDQQGRACLANGALAGSIASLLDGLKNIIRWTGSALEDMLPMATTNPALLAGVSERKGSLAPGKHADLVVLDNEYNVVFTMVNGKIVASRDQDG